MVHVFDKTSGEDISNVSVLAISGVDTSHLVTNAFGIGSAVLPVGVYMLEIRGFGYNALQYYDIQVVSGKLADVQVALETYIIDCPVIVKPLGSTLIQSQGSTLLSREEALHLPAMFFDPGRVAASKPGIIQTNDGINAMSIHGLHPELMRWRINGLEVVNPNHLPNAGTFTDRAAQGAGGVFLVSSQMLGASELHSAAMQPGVGDAVAGVLDIKLRQGDFTPKRTMQIGLLGIDAAVEGSSFHEQLSYLLNYRYSTVGVLSKLGVSFGGEKIAFQDFNGNLVYHPRKGGLVRTFALLGQSSNDFKGDSLTQPLSARNYSEIGFESKTAIVGSQAILPFIYGTSLELGSATSWQMNDRNETRRFPNDPLTLLVDNEYNRRLSNNLIIRKDVSLNARTASIQYSAGVISSHIRLRQTSQNTYPTGLSTLTLQPFIDYQFSGFLNKSEKRKIQYFALDIGLHSLYARVNASFVAQPRFQLQWRPKSNPITYFASSGLHAQMPPWALYGTLDEQKLRNELKPMQAWYHSMGLEREYYHFRRYFSSARVFYQSLFDIALGSEDGLVSALEAQNIDVVTGYGRGRSFGLELQHKIEQPDRYGIGGNLSLFKTELENGSGVTFPSRYDVGFISNLLVERNRIKRKANKKVEKKLTARLVLSGGQRNTPVDIAASMAQQTTVYNYRIYGSQKGSIYYRTDVRYQRRISRSKSIVQTLSFEIQNLSLHANADYAYFDPLTHGVLEKKQLGMVPNINWRLEW